MRDYPKVFKAILLCPSLPRPSRKRLKKYGLRIEPRKETIDMFVITHVEKTPTEN